MGNSSWCTGLFLRFLLVPSPRVDGTDDSLPPGMNVDVLDRDFLLPLAAITLQDVYKPKPADEKRSGHSPTTSSGLPVEDQVRKEWDPRKGGGLPTF
jgi:hypothetical protein